MNQRLLVRLPDVSLGLVLVVTLLFFKLTHEGLYDLDDYLYAHHAHDLATGTYRPLPDPQHLLHDPLRERLMIFGPVAGLFRLLGINIISATLWPLLCTLGCSVLIWLLYRRRAPVVAAGAVLLLGLHYFTLNLSTYLYPDNILMFWCLAGVAALLTGRRPAQQRPMLWGSGFAVLSFAALLCKETVVFYLPFYLGLLAWDTGRRQHGRFWVAALLAGGSLLAAYLAYYQVLTHDPLYRYRIIEQTNAFMSDGNYTQGNAAALTARVTWQPLAFFVGTGMGVLLALAASLVGGRATTAATADATETDAAFWLALAVSTVAFYWWGSTSLTHYNPVSLQARMVTPLLPPLAVAAGFGLQRLWRTGRGNWFVGGALLLAAAYLHSSGSVLYGLLGVLFVGLMLAGKHLPGRLQPGTAGRAGLLLLAVAGALLVRPVYFMRKPTVSSHFEQRRIMQSHLSAPGRGVVFVDDFLLRNYDFHYGFQVPAGLRFRRYFARDSVQRIPGEPTWLLLNRSTLTNEELTRKLIRYSADSVLTWFPRRHLVAQEGKVELYRVEY
ncbi:glycosyltransferase family 39 protein [Hymenobacter sp. BT186]|uniref:Glycosyltransferase family 39 protein n=1 Tax=Hymenobacter telluris TaxID=2816474 RepID=A0A939JBA4_9BACT|nr:glycosyltransferase family 39 protein [Hymenobacter telluris]MBO0358931.1 glycosyltransferase family 39 protein [Hymenobacter telluris]MBW3374957.1 glycosyltransferase family 39 protein [Hymenobacter norwichensis]